MDNKKRYYGLDGLRALSCLGIVAMHVQTNANYELDGFFFNEFVGSLTNLVFLFMVISGFGMCCGYYTRMVNGQIDIVDFYKKRYKKILPFFALLCLIDFVMSPSLSALYEVFANITLCFGLIPNANITVIGVGWFIGTVFAFYFLFPFFCFLLANKKRAWIAFCSSILMNLLCVYYFGVSRKSIAYSFVYFMLGGMIYLYRNKLKDSNITRVLLLAVMLIAAIVYYNVGMNIIVMLLLNGVMLLYGMAVSEKNILNAKILQLLGGISFEVYLCHMIVFRVIEKLGLLRLLSNDYLNYLIVYILVVAGAVVFASCGKWFINKIITVIERGVKNG